MTKKLTQKKIDKVFEGFAYDLYDKFIENAVGIYASLFPEKCSSKNFAEGLYDMVRERLIVEFGALYTEAKGEKNVKSNFKKEKAGIKRTAAK